ncbi:uncharacterized protein LOC111617722 [Centruroides sculpturatus]|uniref:uncharacterized protein LOC111617722 n=1 Tax=Centruroides sculpturatus TaxID=218467 RepID=UPI000C6D8E9D|nr:uncharacterized protein LOC111617722 [Centruroides sculpturatus]
MKFCILLVLGVIACNVGATNGFRMTGQIDDLYVEFCGFEGIVRSIILNCIDLSMSFKDRQMFSDIARCFDEDNFVDLMTKLCGKPYAEIQAMVESHEDCLKELDLDDESYEIDVDKDVLQNCAVENALKNNLELHDL